jgi:exonuclease III
MPDKIKLINLNVQGFKNPKKRDKVLTWARKKKPDIISIQEAHIEQSDAHTWKDQWKGRILYSPGANNSRGVALLIDPNTNPTINDEKIDENGRWQIVDMEIKGQNLVVCNYYGPNEDDPSHMERMLEELEGMNKGNIILTGDFNLVLNLELDKSGGLKRTNTKCRNTLVEWMENRNATDIWRSKNPQKRRYTWVSHKKPLVMCRLDFFILTSDLQGIYQDCDIIPGYRTDHSCTTLTLEPCTEERGRGFWKFNSSLLKDETLKTKLAETLEETIELNPGTNKTLLWDLMKCKMRETCINLASKKNKERKTRHVDLSAKLKEVEERMDALRSNNNKVPNFLEEEAETLRREIDEIITHETRGNALRSKATWYEEGDKASKLFLNLEKQRSSNKVIRKLIKEDGSTTSNKTEILREEELFYRKLYSSNHNETKNNHHVRQQEKDLLSIGEPHVQKEDQDQLTTRITEEELWEIINSSPPNKSPGCDGFTNEFYKGMWLLIKTHLVH